MLFTDNALDLAEGNLTVAAIVELRRARALMRRHLLRVLEEATIEQIDGDARRREAGALPSWLWTLRVFALRSLAQRHRSRHVLYSRIGRP